jgi:hypothetical protein
MSGSTPSDVAHGQATIHLVSEVEESVVGAGSWSGMATGEGIGAPKLYEADVYMPLTGKDLPAYKPGKVLFGCVHTPINRELVHYPGSPTPRTSPSRDRVGPFCMQPETTRHLAARMQSHRSQ